LWSIIRYMNFDPRGKPNIIELSSATHPSIIKYGTQNDETGEYVITVRVKYGDLEGLKKELMRFAGATIDTSKGIPMSRVMELSNDVDRIIDFFEKSAKENVIFTKDDCEEEYPADLCAGEYENIIVTTILNKKNASSAVVREGHNGPVEAKPCGSCGKLSSLLCARCKKVAYCDGKCQTAAWPTHKAVCVKPKGCAVSAEARAPSAAARAPSAAARAPSSTPNADSPTEGGRRKQRRKTLKKNKKGRQSRKA